MSISGNLLIGAVSRQGKGPPFSAVDARSGEQVGAPFYSATHAEITEACMLADAAFDSYRSMELDRRAVFLETIAANIMAIGDELIEHCMVETALPRARLEGERGRTVGQLRFMAEIVRTGTFLDVRVEPAQLERQPIPRPDLRLRNVPLGPVAVFGASNFPLAFSVAGGDTASALAAGCPVIVKAHSAHPMTSALVGRAIQAAVEQCALPEGVFSLLFDAEFAVGQALVSHPLIKAVGFTGSRRGGQALMDLAAKRPVPIPVYAEMSSINPVILLPAALAARGPAIAKAFVAALTLGAGQFCTNPGLVLGVQSPQLERFIAAAGGAVEASEAAGMLTAGIHGAYCRGASELQNHHAVQTIARGKLGGNYTGQARLFATTADAFLVEAGLSHEVFGAAGLVVRCKDLAQLRAVLVNLEGQLTAALHIDPADYEEASALLPLLERKVGRIVVNGFGTGVEVSRAMVHGGPFPATSDGRSTSVGSLSIQRFLRPVSYQDLPAVLRPRELRT